MSNVLQSKSLKNFTSIRQALAPTEDGTPAWTPRGLRIVFLLGGWKEGVEITEDLVKQGKVWEEKVTNFFLKAVDMKRNEFSSTDSISSQSSSKETLVKILDKAKEDLNSALCDSFNTPNAMETLSSLITQVNSIRQTELDPVFTIEIAQWITKVITIFGLNGTTTVNGISKIGWEGVEIPSAAQPYIYPLSQLRDDVRKLARSKDYSPSSSLHQIQSLVSSSKTTQSEHPLDNKYAATLTNFHTEVLTAAEKPNTEAKTFLALCDALRDTHLWNLDIYLEDRDPPLGALVRPLDASLKQARREKEQRDAERAEAKVKREREEAEKQREKDEKAKVSPRDIFRTSEYSAWDDDGVPTKDKDGNDVTKSKRKVLAKEWKRQEKMHEDWQKRTGGK
jgi:cysteinyl-tRNA synthetase